MIQKAQPSAGFFISSDTHQLLKLIKSPTQSAAAAHAWPQAYDYVESAPVDDAIALK